MPSSSGGQIRDIYFVDSLLGFAVSDSSILKTTTGGDTWTVKLTGYYIFNGIQFINSTTGFASGGNNTLLKTTNTGENWTPIILPSIYPFDMSVVSENFIWLVNTNGLTGGVFRTTNGGANWEQQINVASANPDHIYMYNQRIGFCSGGGQLRRTTNSGLNWNVIGGDNIREISFSDSLTGWMCSVSGMKKTTNGGLNWVTQTIPSGGIIQSGFIYDFWVLNKDTLWGCGGGVMYPNGQTRGILYRTTNGGAEWRFQIPDTSINISYSFIQFTDKFHGWVYDNVPLRGGIHTTNGADPTWLLGIQQIGNNIPLEYKLFQNYPNPFNPTTNIKYSVKREKSNVKLIVFDIQGKQIAELVKQKQSAGTYEVDFSGSIYSSGIYFYSIIIDGDVIDTKKMILLK